jgi:ABC-type multidrug transport system fused ATPase/permease subunit
MDDEEFGDEASGLGLEELLNLGLWTISATVTVILIGILGFSIVSGLFLIGMMLYAGQRNWIILLLVGVIVPVAIWQITWYAFSIQLPVMISFD